MPIFGIIKETGLQVKLPSSWREFSLKQYLSFRNADFDEADIISILSGIDKDILRQQPGFDLSKFLLKQIDYIGKMPDLVKEPLPKFIEVDGKFIKVQHELDMYITYGQKLDLEAHLRELLSENIEPTFENCAVQFLSIIFYPEITGKVYKDVYQIQEVTETIESLPAIESLRLASFFLDFMFLQRATGNLLYLEREPTKTETALHKWHLLWFKGWRSFQTFTLSVIWGKVWVYLRSTYPLKLGDGLQLKWLQIKKRRSIKNITNVFIKQSTKQNDGLI